ncbi:MAG: D-alanyl-D-alanine carboxypeptidase [Oscillospiraceae bacterium]|nr:D-alanyl-D-alanine carboxypeptidase [Oscillospiraceae bacterium]
MKRYACFFFLWIFIGALLWPSIAWAAYGETPPATASQTSVVMDAATGQVLVEKGMDHMMYPASITKIMTVLLALENGDPDKIHTMSYEATHSIDPNSTHIALTEGEQLSLRDLMFATMIASANDAANGVAECVAGSIDQFVVMMNEKAKEIGAVNTHFANANGLHNTDHYTTAYDMALITRYALGVKGFREYWRAEEYTIQPTNKQAKARQMGTQHSMFVESQFTYEGCTGGKLGYTGEARHTSATSAKRGDIELICVTMGSQKYEKYEDTAALFDYCFDSFDKLTLSKLHLKGFVIPVMEGDTQVQEVRIYPDNSIDLLLHRQYSADDLSLEYQVPESYRVGEDVIPSVKVSLKAQSGSMYADLGSFPLQFSLADTAEQKLDEATGLPVKDNSLFWKNLLGVLKWVGVTLAAVAGCAVLVLLLAWVRRFLHRRKRRRHQRRRERLEAKRAAELRARQVAILRARKRIEEERARGVRQSGPVRISIQSGTQQRYSQTGRTATAVRKGRR